IVVTAFRLDDFHPDRLIERVSMLRDLRAMREQGASSPPSSSREPPRRAEPKTDAVVRELSGGSLLDRIVDNNEASTPGGALLGTAPRDELSRFVEQAVRKHVVPDAPAEQRDVAAKIDAV